MKVNKILSTILCVVMVATVFAVAVPMNVSAEITYSETKLIASDAAAGDEFGIVVSIDGDTAIVSALLDDDAGSSSGSAYVFVRDGTSWTEQAKLIASDGAPGDWFSRSVSISGDTAVVGALHDDDKGSNSGSTYVFVRDGTSWTEQAKLTASDSAAGDLFGVSVVISGDTILIGARSDDDAGSNSGSAYVFVRDGTSWTEQAKLTASDGAAGDDFGRWLSIEGDTAIIGANHDDDAGYSSGSAYIFERDGTSWTEQAKLTASDAATGDRFGLRVAISGDTAMVGAIFNDDAGSNSGSAYVFIRDGTSWTEQAKLTASDAAAGDAFGVVGLSGDTAVIGAQCDDDAGPDSGSSYVFVRSGSVWSEEFKITASDGEAGDYFGDLCWVDGGTAIIGARYNDEAGTDAGAAYVYELSVLTPTGTNVEVEPHSDISITFSEVTGEGSTSATASTENPGSEKSGFKFLGTYYDITTTATVEGPITIGISYDDSGMPLQREQNLKLFHWDGTNWVDVTTSVDTDNNIIYGTVSSFSWFAIAHPIIYVQIDIKPGSDPNSINLGSNGNVPVAIFSSSDFDATTIDPASVILAGASVGLKGKSSIYMASEEDINDDGLLDLMVHVDINEMGLVEGSTEAVLEGLTSDGINIEGNDSVNIVPP